MRTLREYTSVITEEPLAGAKDEKRQDRWYSLVNGMNDTIADKNIGNNHFCAVDINIAVTDSASHITTADGRKRTVG